MPPGRDGRKWRETVAIARATLFPRCWLCGGMINMDLDPQRDPMGWTLDHVVPLQEWIDQGGDPCDLANLLPAHRLCNSRKGTKPVRAPVDRPVVSRRWG